MRMHKTDLGGDCIENEQVTSHRRNTLCITNKHLLNFSHYPFPTTSKSNLIIELRLFGRGANVDVARRSKMDKSPPPVEKILEDDGLVVKFIGDVGQSINHFSHDHPLQLTIVRVPSNLTIVTYCCGAGLGNIEYSEVFYVCRLCNFFIHESCSELPQFLDHPSHTHEFSLFSHAHRAKSFRSDACYNPVIGFAYRCAECDYDVHPSCAFLPLIFKHRAHNHQLNLSYDCSTPKESGDYSCSHCKRIGTWWAYRCNSCKFGIHLNCARATSTRVIGSTTRRTSAT